MFSYPSVLTYVLGAQKNCHIETFFLSTHNICFGCEIRKLVFRYALLTEVLTKFQFNPTNGLGDGVGIISIGVHLRHGNRKMLAILNT